MERGVGCRSRLEEVTRKSGDQEVPGPWGRRAFIGEKAFSLSLSLALFLSLSSSCLLLSLSLWPCASQRGREWEEERQRKVGGGILGRLQLTKMREETIIHG